MSSFEDYLEQASLLLGDQCSPDALQEANEYINLALQIRPQAGRAWILKSYIMSALEDDAAALAAAEMARRHLPADPECSYVQAAALADMGLFGDALEAADQGLMLLGRGADVGHGQRGWLTEDLYYIKGTLLEANGHPDEAVAIFEQGLRRCPDSALLKGAAEPLRNLQRRRFFTVIDGGRAR